MVEYFIVFNFSNAESVVVPYYMMCHMCVSSYKFLAYLFCIYLHYVYDVIRTAKNMLFIMKSPKCF